MSDFQPNLIRTATGIPNIVPANPKANTKEILKIIIEAEKSGVSVLAFPELSLTGASCGSLFHQDELYLNQEIGLSIIINETKGSEILIVIGGYFKFKSSYYNCAFVVRGGKLLAIIPKVTSEGSPWFSSWDFNHMETTDFKTLKNIPIVSNQIINAHENNISFAITIGDDYRNVFSYGSYLVSQGADIIINLGAESRLVGKKKERENQIKSISSNLSCGYIYSSLGAGESSASSVMAGDSLIVENGQILSRGQSNYKASNLWLADIDIDVIKNAKLENKNIKKLASLGLKNTSYCNFSSLKTLPSILESLNSYSRTPFLPSAKAETFEQSMEIFWTQTYALVKRLDHVESKKILVNVSDTLNSILALMVSIKAMEILKKPSSDIIGVFTPSFDTKSVTFGNIFHFVKDLGATFREISIIPSSVQHFKDIGKNPNQRDSIYENIQNRQKSQIIFDLANMENGLPLGTADMTDISLGFTTLSGDHMSSYNINGGVPKTVMPSVIDYALSLDRFKHTPMAVKEIFQNAVIEILGTQNKKSNLQVKSDIVKKPFELYDFFLYYTLKDGTQPEKLFQMAIKTFGNIWHKAEIKKFLVIFYRNFFSNQFKVNCSPDAPRVLSPSLHNFTLPGDVNGILWITKAESIKPENIK